jgi:predicted DNA-binding protein
VKTLSIRLSEDQAEALEALAAIEARDRVDLIRDAIDQMVDRARNDAAFQARRQAALERYANLLSRLDSEQVNASAATVHEGVAAT